MYFGLYGIQRFSLLNPPMAYGCLISCLSSAFFSWFIHDSTYLNPHPSFVLRHFSPCTYIIPDIATNASSHRHHLHSSHSPLTCMCLHSYFHSFCQPLQSVMDLAHLTTPASNKLFPSMTEDGCCWMHNIAVAFLIISFVLYHTYPVIHRMSHVLQIQAPQVAVAPVASTGPNTPTPGDSFAYQLYDDGKGFTVNRTPREIKSHRSNKNHIVTTKF